MSLKSRIDAGLERIGIAVGFARRRRKRGWPGPFSIFLDLPWGGDPVYTRIFVVFSSFQRPKSEKRKLFSVEILAARRLNA